MPDVPVSTAELSFDEAFPGLFSCAYRSAFRVIGSQASAEDIAIEATTRCALRWSKVGRYAAPFVSKVAANLAIDEVRREARARRHVVQDDVGGDDTTVADRRVLVATLLHLPRRQREVLVLRLICDLTEADTAAQLGISPGSVKQHFARGVAAARSRLTQEELEHE